MSPLSRGATDSFAALPPVRRGVTESFDALPPVRREERTGRHGGAARSSRAADDSYDRLPPARAVGESFERTSGRGGSDGARHSTASRMTPARRPTGGGRAARRRAEESFDRLPIVPRGGDDHRQADPALSKIRVVPALSGMDSALERLPKHGRPEDYDDYLIRPRSGPEDSYDQMPAVERPVRSSGGRRRA
jgi:hypothetical protein